MTGSNVASQMALNAVLRAGARRINRRINAQRPASPAFHRAGTGVGVATGQAARIVAVLHEAILLLPPVLERQSR